MAMQMLWNDDELANAAAFNKAKLAELGEPATSDDFKIKMKLMLRIEKIEAGIGKTRSPKKATITGVISPTVGPNNVLLDTTDRI